MRENERVCERVREKVRRGGKERGSQRCISGYYYDSSSSAESRIPANTHTTFIVTVSPAGGETGDRLALASRTTRIIATLLSHKREAHVYSIQPRQIYT